MLLRKVKASQGHRRRAEGGWPVSPGERQDVRELILVLHTVPQLGSCHISRKGGSLKWGTELTTCSPSIAQIQARGHDLYHQWKNSPRHRRHFMKHFLQTFWLISPKLSQNSLMPQNCFLLLIKKATAGHFLSVTCRFSAYPRGLRDKGPLELGTVWPE